MSRKVGKHPALAAPYGKAALKSGKAILRRAQVLATALDSNPEIRAAVVARIVKAAEKAPVALLHQVMQSLELANGE